MRSRWTSLCFALLLPLVLCDVMHVKPPQVHVYTRYPPKNGVPNQFICHGTGFHPPKINLKLLVDGKELKDCKQNDLTFTQDWTYYTTKHGPITFQDGATYTCEVQHNEGDIKTYHLDTLM
ncbi:beta-2-microglobulin [Gastrophryne carolinensis]